MTNMRLLLGNKFWYPKGGVETYLFELIEELPACGYDVIPFAMKHARNLQSAYADFFVDEVDYHAPQPLATRRRALCRPCRAAPSAQCRGGFRAACRRYDQH